MSLGLFFFSFAWSLFEKEEGLALRWQVVLAGGSLSIQGGGEGGEESPEHGTVGCSQWAQNSIMSWRSGGRDGRDVFNCIEHLLFCSCSQFPHTVGSSTKISFLWNPPRWCWGAGQQVNKIKRWASVQSLPAWTYAISGRWCHCTARSLSRYTSHQSPTWNATLKCVLALSLY